VIGRRLLEYLNASVLDYHKFSTKKSNKFVGLKDNDLLLATLSTAITPLQKDAATESYRRPTRVQRPSLSLR
jgi:hypothetical protein